MNIKNFLENLGKEISIVEDAIIEDSKEIEKILKLTPKELTRFEENKISLMLNNFPYKIVRTTQLFDNYGWTQCFFICPKDCYLIHNIEPNDENFTSRSRGTASYIWLKNLTIKKQIFKDLESSKYNNIISLR